MMMRLSLRDGSSKMVILTNVAFTGLRNGAMMERWYFFIKAMMKKGGQIGNGTLTDDRAENKRLAP